MRTLEPKQKVLLAVASVGAGFAAREFIRRRAETSLEGKVVVITGGSRGLGLSLARAFAAEGSRLVLCARDEAELDRAREDIESRGSPAFTVRCDVTNRGDVKHLIDAAIEHYGRIDVLVNNAGVIQVGPVENMTLQDFEQAMNVMFWGVVYPTLAVLPHLKERRSGRIVNITSIGGKVSVPHLLPYNCAKFAAVGFSEGLRAELMGHGIRVVTIAPGLMRTGSYLNALFKGDQERESAWFGLSASMPLITMSGKHAARQIVAATKRGQAEKILTAPASALARFHGLFPGATTGILGLVNRMILPAPAHNGRELKRGAETRSLRSPVLTTLTVLGRLAARRFHQQGA